MSSRSRQIRISSSVSNSIFSPKQAQIVVKRARRPFRSQQFRIPCWVGDVVRGGRPSRRCPRRLLLRLLCGPRQAPSRPHCPPSSVLLLLRAASATRPLAAVRCVVRCESRCFRSGSGDSSSGGGSGGARNTGGGGERRGVSAESGAAERSGARGGGAGGDDSRGGGEDRCRIRAVHRAAMVKRDRELNERAQREKEGRRERERENEEKVLDR